MNRLKKFDEYLFEGFDINKIQFLYKRILGSLGVKLYYVSKYETSIISLLPVIDNLINAQGYIFEKTNKNIILISLYAISILTHESTDKINKIHDVIKNIPITDIEVQYLINGLNNLRNIFSMIAKEREVEDFYDMLKETDMLILFSRVINNMILNDRLNIDMFTGKFDGIKNHLGEKGFELLIHNILNKMNILVGTGNKFQNVDNLKPMFVNDEFKSPMYKSDRFRMSESLLDKLNGPNDDEVINNLKNKDPERLLDLGIQQEKFEMVKSAIENGAKLDYTKNTPLVNFGMSENWDKLKLYMDNQIYINSDYNWLLKNYAHINDTKILNILVQDCNVKNIGDVALKTACFNNSYEAVQLLIDNGVDVNAYNDYLLRELITYKYPNYKMIKLLLDNGANPHVNNDSLFKCPVQEIVDLLKKY